MNQKWLKYLAYAIILSGVVLRVVVWLQNRSLIIDEANVARNIYERGFAGLVLPLLYEQYAPPIFLWILKLSTALFGYGEMALRLFPLLCGIGSLFLFYQVLKKYTTYTSIWYALVLMASGYMYLRYSTEVKQYSCDVAVVLGLILLALRKDLLTARPSGFLLYWFVIGSLTVWLSMPGVFMLAAIGFYYLYIVLKAKAYNKLTPLVIMGVLWGLQFLFYYMAILAPQANSDYLQWSHKDYFLYPLPVTGEQLSHNWELVVMKLLGNAGGHWALSIAFHLLCIVLAFVHLLRREKAKAMLLWMPVLLAIIAAALHQYSLIPRLVLFAMPLLLVLVTVGLEQLLRIKYIAAKLSVLAVCVIAIVNFNEYKFYFKPLQHEELKQSFAWLQEKDIKGTQLYVHDLAKPAYIYYTTIHPGKQQYTSLLGATLLFWDTDYTQLAQSFPDRSALLYSFEEDDQKEQQTGAVLQYHDLVEYINEKERAIFIYKKKTTTP